MTTNIQTQSAGYNSTLGRIPSQGSKALELAINFANDNILIKEFFQEQSREQVDFFQSIYIDNSLSANPVTISVGGSLFSITVKGHTQGFYPLDVPEGKAVLTFSRAVTEATTLNIILFNYVLPYVNWATQ